MNPQSSQELIDAMHQAIIEMDPDVLALADFHARKSRLSLAQYLEFLITKEAAHGRVPRLPVQSTPAAIVST